MAKIVQQFSNKSSMLRIYAVSAIVSVALLVMVLASKGWGAAGTVGILALLEITFSFDNAVINAKVLERMTPIWQTLFMTVGIAIAVFGMRVLFPLVLVMLTSGLSMSGVIDIALHDPTVYAEKLELAHPSIAAFGGVFLLMLFLDFVFEEREITWLSWLERPLRRLGKLDQLSVVVAGAAIMLIGSTWAGEHREAVIAAGLLGMVVYLAVNALDSFFSGDSESGSGTAQVAKAGLFGFLYLELVDASFSFDGVIGAFAITDQVLLIATGLGIGAVFVRSLTVHVLRRQTLQRYQFLEHGAHWAIGTLAVCLLASLRYEVPEWFTGGIGIALIGSAFLSSKRVTAKGLANSRLQP
jgi:hypothetical protein